MAKSVRLETTVRDGGETHQHVSEPEKIAEARLTTNQGIRVSDNQNSLKAGGRGPTLLEDSSYEKRSSTSITSEFLNGSCTPVVRGRMGSFSLMNRCQTSQAQTYSSERGRRFRYSPAFRL